MRHGSRQNISVALAALGLGWVLGSAVAQTSVQQAMLRKGLQAAAPASDQAETPSTNVASALQQVGAQAAVVFTGSVTSVQPDPTGGAQVRFLVERAIRGTVSGAEYTVRISSWAGGAGRFCAGERALFLLTAPSVSGYSAPVMGERGIVPLSGDALVGNLDLRWIAADVQRGTRWKDTAGDQAASGEAGSETAQMHAAMISGVDRLKISAGSTPRTAETSDANALTVPDVHAIDRDLVFDLLRSATSAPGQAR